MHHKHVETNRRVEEHNLNPLEYQSFVETLIHQTTFFNFGNLCFQILWIFYIFKSFCKKKTIEEVYIIEMYN